ncbi:hypothetical protein SOV_22600 [Sporomusa ovata DSM 2662]|uniref:Uncharacterized protein n=1 Tax=Sporomusa ovata TaxID=2378 RepID=A0A0U1L4U8_9FIRM|nr:hypothetical protein [Sporomusa ovata]EQB25576.1 hypothetical protein SOV_4c02390 [Sporomusa ovata DSM 2662]CQR74133.1 hypothetical protein SpAn4DRAFT_0595 [Sporomusa ovata]
MTKTELDLTESKDFEQSITRSGKSITVIIETEDAKLELVLSMADFADLIADGFLILNKNLEVA